jgi:hypothetical protein
MESLEADARPVRTGAPLPLAVISFYADEVS